MVADLIRADGALVEYVTERLLEIGDVGAGGHRHVPLRRRQEPVARFGLTDFRNYPADMWAKPGDKQPNRAALAKWGAWVNAWCRENYGRPLFMAMSADLADSTNISGFAKDYGDGKGYGWFNRDTNLDGALLPQGITEFANAGISTGIASVNFSKTPYEDYNGFYAACSTYGSFVYLKYGPMRLFSQLAQDSQIKVGKVLWVAGHSGPETAEDSRTHFGIFAPGRDAALPRRPRDRRAPVGVQRGAGGARRGAQDQRAHHCAAPHAPGDRDSRPRETRAWRRTSRPRAART